MPVFDVSRDILEHDDRIVDDEASRDRQRHQRQIVEAVAQEIHDGERADQRHRHGDRRDQRRARIAQKHEHDQDDQDDRDEQRALDVPSARRGSWSSGRRATVMSIAGETDARRCGQ